MLTSEPKEGEMLRELLDIIPSDMRPPGLNAEQLEGIERLTRACERQKTAQMKLNRAPGQFGVRETPQLSEEDMQAKIAYEQQRFAVAVMAHASHKIGDMSVDAQLIVAIIFTMKVKSLDGRPIVAAYLPDVKEKVVSRARMLQVDVPPDDKIVSACAMYWDTYTKRRQDAQLRSYRTKRKMEEAEARHKEERSERHRMEAAFLAAMSSALTPKSIPTASHESSSLPSP